MEKQTSSLAFGVTLLTGLALLALNTSTRLSSWVFQSCLFLFISGIPAAWILFARKNPGNHWTDLLTLVLLIIQTIPYLMGLFFWLASLLDDGPGFTMG